MIVRRMNLNLFKLLHLSIVWRAHLSQDFGKHVDLGPYAEKIRKMLLAGNGGDEMAFPIFGQVLVRENKTIAYDWVTQPMRGGRFWHAQPYRMCYAGCEWYYFITDHPEPQLASLVRRAYKGDGFMLIAGSHHETHSFREIVREYQATRRARWQLPPYH